jgi:5-methylcytosine-specific restriction endonuclease McrA
VPLVLRRAVAERDEHRCAYVSPDGRRCGEEQWLELHHLHPFARGGAHTLDNLALRCRSHHAYEGERDFGPWTPTKARDADEASSFG